MFELRDYQINIIKRIISELNLRKRCAVSLATGAGKTVIFSSLVNKLSGKILICVHREELVHQTSKTLEKPHDLIIPKTGIPQHDIVVAMVETLNNRIKKDLIDVNDYDYIIVDECHRGEFMKILDRFDNKVIGFTATPNYEKIRYFWACKECGDEYHKAGHCCGEKLQKYKKTVPLSEYYDYLIEGIQINELIEKDYLVKDEQFVLDIDTKRLVFDERKQDYTEESISLVFGSPEAIKNTINNYFEHCKGLKTIIFNPNTLVNQRLYDAMISQGINCKMYDSKNKNIDRKELVEWFRNTADAVLLNVQVFTTGFDVTDVQCIFLNKKTKSINLYLQMVGRGGRITDKIFKPSFKVIDMGNNDEDFGAWSLNRNWKKYFYKKEIKAVGPAQPAAVRDCHKCEAVIAANTLICPVCGAEREYKGGVKGLAYRNGKPQIPSPDKIIEYCERNNLTTLHARKIVYNYVSLMFEKVSAKTLKRTLENGELFAKTHRFIMPYYFAIQRSKLEGNRNRTIETFTNKTIDAIIRGYNTRENL
jgi:superfamily II DNA or RNA helicase